MVEPVVKRDVGTGWGQVRMFLRFWGTENKFEVCRDSGFRLDSTFVLRGLSVWNRLRVDVKGTHVSRGSEGGR